jgi:hypothetical protein
VHPLDHWEEIPPGTNGQLDMEGGFIFPVNRVKGLRCTKEPIEVQEPTKEHLISYNITSGEILVWYSS